MSVFFHRFGLGSSSQSYPDGDDNSGKGSAQKNTSKLSNNAVSWKELLNEDEIKPLFNNGSGEYSDCSDDEIETDDYELSLRQRGKLHDTSALWKCSNSNITTYNDREHDFSETKYKEYDYVELEISEEDTLQNLSLRYRCPVAELKRINNLISNQEFFGLRKVRIPVKKHSLLTEILPNAKEKYDKTNHFFNDIAKCEENTQIKEVRTVVVGIGPMGCGGSKEEAQIFLKKMDEDLIRIKNATEHHDELCNEYSTTETLQFRPLVAEKKSCNDGIDCGIHWRNLLIVVLILGVVLPAVGALYMHFTSWN